MKRDRELNLPVRKTLTSQYGGRISRVHKRLIHTFFSRKHAHTSKLTLPDTCSHRHGRCQAQPSCQWEGSLIAASSLTLDIVFHLTACSGCYVQNCGRKRISPHRSPHHCTASDSISSQRRTLRGQQARRGTRGTPQTLVNN